MTLNALQARLGEIWRSLTETPVGLSEPERRRARVLAVFTLVLNVSVLLFLVLIFELTANAQFGFYFALLAEMFFVFGIAYWLNRGGHYTVAASIVIAATVAGTWVAIFSTLGTLSRDITPLLYIISPMILCSFLLPARVTLALGIVQFTILFALSMGGLIATPSGLPTLLSYILFTTVLSVISSLISRQDLEQIDRQTKELIASHMQLHELAIRDALTGLYNRRYLEETLERELVRAEREQSSLGVIMVDVDYFKRFNDANGHAAGDALLREISASLREHIRGSDVACRYGGDELTVILPNSSPDVTRQRAEALREGAKSILLEYQHRYLEPITISLGVAMFPQDGGTMDSVLKAADDALYLAKQSGRDRVSVANFKPPTDASATPPTPSQAPPPTTPKAQLYTTPQSKILRGKTGLANPS